MIPYRYVGRMNKFISISDYAPLQNRRQGEKQHYGPADSETTDVSSTTSKTLNIQPHTKRIYGIVFVILLVDLLAFTCILPLLPALFDYYGKKDANVSCNISLEN